jgi:hypothetical protein
MGAGFFFRNMALPLGGCSSPYLNPNSRPLLDCDRVQAAF